MCDGRKGRVVFLLPIQDVIVHSDGGMANTKSWQLQNSHHVKV